MNGYEMYEAVFDELQKRYDEGELTEEQATLLNDAAYEKYVVEGCCKKEEAGDSGDDESDGEAPAEKPEDDDKEDDKEEKDEDVDRENLIKKINKKAKDGEITDEEKEMFLAIVDEA